MIIVITGGSGSGKSAYAEERAAALGRGEMIYLATMASRDEESLDRIRKHRERRAPLGFRTVERPFDLAGEAQGWADKSGRTVLLECMSNLAANEMFMAPRGPEGAAARIQAGIDRLREKCDNLVIVTNEVFSDGGGYDETTQRWIALLGGVNAYLGQLADEVWEVVAGIPLKIKG